MTSTFRLGNPHTKATIYHIHVRTHNDTILFGQVSGQTTRLNEAGQIAADELKQAALTSRNIDLDKWIIIPDGIRALVMLEAGEMFNTKAGYGKTRSQLKPRALSSFIASFKAAAATRINLVRGQPGAPVWKKGYSDQRVDDELTLARIRHVLSKMKNEV